MTALDLFDRRCPECNEPVSPPSVRCCCRRCLHPLEDHTDQLDCRICSGRCGIDCNVGGRFTSRAGS